MVHKKMNFGYHYDGGKDEDEVVTVSDVADFFLCGEPSFDEKKTSIHDCPVTEFEPAELSENFQKVDIAFKVGTKVILKVYHEEESKRVIACTIETIPEEIKLKKSKKSKIARKGKRMTMSRTLDFFEKDRQLFCYQELEKEGSIPFITREDILRKHFGLAERGAYFRDDYGDDDDCYYDYVNQRLSHDLEDPCLQLKKGTIVDVKTYVGKELNVTGFEVTHEEKGITFTYEEEEGGFVCEGCGHKDLKETVKINQGHQIPESSFYFYEDQYDIAELYIQYKPTSGSGDEEEEDDSDSDSDMQEWDEKDDEVEELKYARLSGVYLRDNSLKDANPKFGKGAKVSVVITTKMKGSYLRHEIRLAEDENEVLHFFGKDDRFYCDELLLLEGSKPVFSRGDVARHYFHFKRSDNVLEEGDLPIIFGGYSFHRLFDCQLHVDLEQYHRKFTPLIDVGLIVKETPDHVVKEWTLQYDDLTGDGDLVELTFVLKEDGKVYFGDKVIDWDNEKKAITKYSHVSGMLGSISDPGPKRDRDVSEEDEAAEPKAKCARV